MNIFKLCAAILQDFGHPKNRRWHTQLNVCEKEGFPCFLYLIQIFALDSKCTFTTFGHFYCPFGMQLSPIPLLINSMPFFITLP
jgi:hypothetical protein